MQDATDPISVDHQFFDALVASGIDVLSRLLADDFILVDLMRGSEITKASLLQAIEAGAIKFESIETLEARARRYASTAIVVGRTRMRIRAGADTVEVKSRYT